MFLFDLADYYGSRIIGNQYEEIPICDTKWCDMATTARETRNAYLKTLNQWYLASVTCLEDGDCKDAILAKWAVVQNDITLYNNSLVAFWGMMCNETNLEDCTGEYDPTLYQNYINAQDTLQCDIEELTYLVDDGVSGVNPTTTTTTTIAPPPTTTTTTTIAPTTTTTTTVNPCPNCVSSDITIGTQTWQKCNLNVTTYRDNTPIPEVTDPTAWANLTTGAWCWYNNDSANGPTYGKMYNWHAVNNTANGGIAPVGYHVPTVTEFATLVSNLGGLTVAGGKMREAGVCHWRSPNAGATNSSLFTALPGGDRYSNGQFNAINGVGTWWSSTATVGQPYTARLLQLDWISNSADISSAMKESGYSVRLIKD